MADDWDYADLSRKAAEHGGPQQLLDDISNTGYNRGRNDGYKQGEHDGYKQGEHDGIAKGISWAALVAAIIWIVSIVKKKVKDTWNKHKKKKLENQQKSAQTKINDQIGDNNVS